MTLALIIAGAFIVYTVGVCAAVGYAEGRYTEPSWEPGFLTFTSVFLWPLALIVMGIFRICEPAYDLGWKTGSKRRLRIAEDKRLAELELKNQREQEALIREMEESPWKELERRMG